MKRTWDEAQGYGELGIIETVCLRNFMCHDNLSFEFDPHMNFIIGQNGSGKSAVLTGIILALGGKSGATGRYHNIKGFIKTGKHSATVSVTLKNCGPEAYKVNKYGSKITVERNFNTEGVSHYKIKSKLGHIISTSKEELNNILNTMDIQIENPVTVLTQEISRNFLVSKNSKSNKLFQLFYSGTGLSRVEEDYNKASQQKKDADAEIKLKKAALPEMEKEVKKLRYILDRTSKVKELRNELFWARVIQFEKERDEECEASEKLSNEISVLKEKLDKCQVVQEKQIQTINQAKIDKKSSNDEMNRLRRELQQLMIKRNDLSLIIREKKGKLTRHETEVMKLSSEAQSLENMIKEMRLKNQSDVNQDTLRNEERINVLKQQVVNVNKEINVLTKKNDLYLETLGSRTQEMDTLQEEINDLKSSLTNVVREKQNLIAGLKNRVDLFGPEMKNLLRDINQLSKSGLFKVTPKGPIGLYLNVKSPEWNFAVQECLKIGMLKSFCCDNQHDAKQLSYLIDKYFHHHKPSIITAKFIPKVHNVDLYKTKFDHPTVLDMLEISDPVIANCLIDQRKIENILLVANQMTAINLMLHKPPENCISTYTLNGDMMCSKPYRYYSCRSYKQTCVLKTLNQDDIMRKDEEMQSLNSEIALKLSTKDNLQRVIDKIEEEKKQNNKEFSNLKIKLKNLVAAMRDEQTDDGDKSKDINCLQSDMEQVQNEKKNSENKLLVIQQDIRTKEQEIYSYENSIREYKAVLKEKEELFQNLTAKIDECESKKASLDSAKTKLESQQRSLEHTLSECEQKLRDVNGALRTSAKAATNVGQRVETLRSPDVILQLLEDTEKIQENMKYDQETLVTEYEEKVKRFNGAKAELDKQERINNRIEKMMDKRFLEFKKLCSSGITALTCSFVTLLTENDFSGYPKVDLEAQTLEIIVQPNKTAAKVKGGKRNLTQLSGGERSYVTIAFLLALWDRIHMPFRILDEYDVFMDSNNRHISINLLINAARVKRNVQYIFLSPLELPPMAHSSHVKIHKMPAPKR